MIHASGSRHAPKSYGWPDVGLYFDRSWKLNELPASEWTQWKGPTIKGKDGVKYTPPAETQYAVIEWPDYSTPGGAINEVCQVLEYALNQAADGKFVDIGCIGAHGRTGTALAAMLILLGEVDADAAIEWVRSKYCIDAIESNRQEDWLWEVAKVHHGADAMAGYEAHLKRREEAKKKSPYTYSSGGYEWPKVSGTWAKKDDGTWGQLDNIDDKKDDDKELDDWLYENAAKYMADEAGRTMPNAEEIEELCDDVAYMYGIDAQKLWNEYSKTSDDVPAMVDGRCTWCETPEDYCLCYSGSWG